MQLYEDAVIYTGSEHPLLPRLLLACCPAGPTDDTWRGSLRQHAVLRPQGEPAPGKHPAMYILVSCRAQSRAHGAGACKGGLSCEGVMGL